MRSSEKVRPGHLGVLAMVIAGGLLVGAEPPPELIGGLGSEAYPERVSAEKALQAWAEKEGDVAKQWLLENHRNSGNPEIRRRSLTVLKSVVLGELTRQRPGFVGIGMASVKLSKEAGLDGFGVEVQAVNPGTPAEKSGLEVTDVIVSLDGKGWANADAPHEFAGRIGSMRGGDKIRLGVLRNGKKMEIELTLASRPWSAGVYSEKQLLRADPFAAPARGLLLPLDEKRAESEAFRKWMEQQKPLVPTH